MRASPSAASALLIGFARMHRSHRSMCNPEGIPIIQPRVVPLSLDIRVRLHAKFAASLKCRSCVMRNSGTTLGARTKGIRTLKGFHQLNHSGATADDISVKNQSCNRNTFALPDSSRLSCSLLASSLPSPAAPAVTPLLQPTGPNRRESGLTLRTCLASRSSEASPPLRNSAPGPLRSPALANG